MPAEIPAPRSWTLAEAERVIPEVAYALEVVRDARATIRTRYPALRARMGRDAGGAGDTGLFLAVRAYRAGLERVERLGVVVRDPDAGLVDFLGERGGLPVWLSWRLGEGTRIAWWHPLDQGPAARLPL